MRVQGGANIGDGLRAIIFDLDGTLIHSEIDFERMNSALIEIYLEQGVPRELMLIGKGVSENMHVARDYLLKHLNEGQLTELEDTIETRLEEIELDSLPSVRPVEGAKEVILELRSNELEIGLLTRGSRKYAMAALRVAKLKDDIDHMICRDDFPWWEAKPNGMALHRLARMIGVKPEECIVVGDHRMDMECAEIGGARFLGVLTGSLDRGSWEAMGCPVVIGSIADLPRLLPEIADCLGRTH
jgi:phosphoglycolate phosphatase